MFLNGYLSRLAADPCVSDRERLFLIDLCCHAFKRTIDARGMIAGQLPAKPSRLLLVRSIYPFMTERQLKAKVGLLRQLATKGLLDIHENREMRRVIVTILPFSEMVRPGTSVIEGQDSVRQRTKNRPRKDKIRSSEGQDSVRTNRDFETQTQSGKQVTKIAKSAQHGFQHVNQHVTHGGGGGEPPTTTEGFTDLNLFCGKEEQIDWDQVSSQAWVQGRPPSRAEVLSFALFMRDQRGKKNSHSGAVDDFIRRKRQKWQRGTFIDQWMGDYTGYLDRYASVTDEFEPSYVNQTDDDEAPF